MKRQQPTMPIGYTEDPSTSAAGAPQFLDSINLVAAVPRRGDEEWHTASPPPAMADPLDHRRTRDERTRAQHYGRGAKR